MKVLIWIISLLNAYFGIDNLLNAVGVAQSSKYSTRSNWIFGILFLGLAVGAVYLMLGKQNNKLALLASIGPWILAGVFLFFSLIFGDYK